MNLATNSKFGVAELVDGNYRVIETFETQEEAEVEASKLNAKGDYTYMAVGLVHSIMGEVFYPPRLYQPVRY